MRGAIKITTSLALAAASEPWPPGYDLPLYMHRHVIKNARARNAVCNDGSPAVFFYRGCNETYYKNDLGGCVNVSSVWSIVFENAGEYCYDEASCKERAARMPSLTSSLMQNSSTIIDGLLQPFPESNPNFYKSHAVFVPYCSSDLWLGNSSTSNFEFRGAAIMRAVIEDLLSVVPSGHDDDGETEDKYRYPIRSAEFLLLTGGPGVAAQVDSVVATLPESVQRGARMLCDGCVRLDLEPMASVHARPCTGVKDCPFKDAMKMAWGMWGAAKTIPLSQLLAPALLKAVATPLLVQHPLFDEIQLRQLRAWPPTKSNATALYVQHFRDSVAEQLSNTRFAFGAACSKPLYYTTSHEAFYYIKTNGQSFTGGLVSAVPEFLKDPSGFARGFFIDKCKGVDCNPSKCGNDAHIF